MHIDNGTVTPSCGAYRLAAASSGWVLATVLLRRSRVPEPLPFALATSAVFALQALNVPVLAGVSGHLVGAFLLAYWLGALWGLAGICIVLAAQGVLVGDGGWMSYGLNVLNLGILPCLVVYPIWKRRSTLATRIDRLQEAVAPFADYTLISTLIAGAGIARVAGRRSVPTESEGLMLMQHKPAFPSADKRWRLIDATMRRHGYAGHSLIEALHTAQESFGYLDETALRYIAAGLRLPLSKVFGVVTFYHFFTLKPQGEHTCVVCMGTACYIKGAPALLGAMEEQYGVKPGQTTPDGRLSVLTARCIGSCGLAPAAVLDGEVVGRLDKSDMTRRIQHLITTQSRQPREQDLEVEQP